MEPNPDALHLLPPVVDDVDDSALRQELKRDARPICAQCPLERTVASNQALRRHVISAHIEGIAEKCRGCNRWFKTDDLRSRCERGHIEPFSCGVNGCPESYNRNDVLKKHLETEHGIVGVAPAAAEVLRHNDHYPQPIERQSTLQAQAQLQNLMSLSESRRRARIRNVSEEHFSQWLDGSIQGVTNRYYEWYHQFLIKPPTRRHT